VSSKTGSRCSVKRSTSVVEAQIWFHCPRLDSGRGIIGEEIDVGKLLIAYRSVVSRVIFVSTTPLTRGLTSVPVRADSGYPILCVFVNDGLTYRRHISYKN